MNRIISFATHPAVRWFALLALCAAYLQGGWNKLTDFSEVIAEMQHFGVSPAPVMAVMVIVLEFGASALILSGQARWLGALALGTFTVMATFLANHYWTMTGDARFMNANTFYEHLGLAGGFLFVAIDDLRERDG